MPCWRGLSEATPAKQRDSIWEGSPSRLGTRSEFWRLAPAPKDLAFARLVCDISL